MTAPVEVKVYEPDATTLIGGGAVPRRFPVQWRDENNGIGSGQFDLHLDDAFLASNPSILDPFNIIKLKPTGVTDPVYAFQLEELRPTQVTSEENAGRMVTLAGRQVRSILDTAAVSGSGDHRTFDFSAMDLPGWPGDWTTPVGVLAADDTTARHGNPTDFPDASAEWISYQDPELNAPAERMWLRTDVTAIADVEVKVWASCDNSMSLRIDGEPIITTDANDRLAWKKTFTWDGTLTAGNHVISAWVDNAAQLTDNPSAFRFVMGTYDADGNLDTVIVRSNTVAWYAHGPTSPPGWPAAAILITLLEEAQADGFLPGVTWDFTATDDSASNAWTDAQDIQIPVGEDLLTTSNRWAGTVFDLHMTPDLVLQAWLRRGSDLSASVAFTPGTDVTSHAPTAGYGQIRNVVRAQWTGGWVEVEDTTSVTAHGRRVMVLAAGDSGSELQATAMAQQALDDAKDPQTTLPVGMTSAAGPQPFDDYNLGDTVSAPGLLSGMADARVMAISGAEQDNRIDWTIDLYPET